MLAAIMHPIIEIVSIPIPCLFLSALTQVPDTHPIYNQHSMVALNVTSAVTFVILRVNYEP